jgi:hypothetical protein
VVGSLYFVVRGRGFVGVVGVATDQRRFADAEVAEDKDFQKDLPLQRILKNAKRYYGLLSKKEVPKK